MAGGLLHTIQEGGIWAILVVALGMLGGLVSLVSLLVAIATKRRTVAIVTALVVLFFGVLILAIGGLGTYFGNSMVASVLDSVAVEQRAMISAEGYRTAEIPFNFAMFFAAFPMFAAFICGALSTIKKE